MEESVKIVLRSIVVAATTLVWPGSDTFAQEWPTRAIRIIAPSTPGGAADMFARLLCEQIDESFRQRCFVENRAGGGGLIGTAAAAQAQPDGYTLTISSLAYHVIIPATNPNTGFDPIRSFSHIAYIGGPPNVFIANGQSGVHSLKDLVDAARRSGPLEYVSPGVGTLGQLLMEAFAKKTSFTAQQIMTKGASQGMMDMVAGNVRFGSMTWTSALGQIRSKTVVPLAISSNQRLSEFPDLPTFGDLGYGDLTAVSWFGLSAPAGVPNDITQKLRDVVTQATQKPMVVTRLQRDAVEVRTMSPDEFTVFIQEETGRWGPLARQVMAPNR